MNATQWLVIVSLALTLTIAWMLGKELLVNKNTKRIKEFCNEYRDKLHSCLQGEEPKRFTVFANERMAINKPWTCGEYLELIGYGLEEVLLEHAARMEQQFPMYIMKPIALISVQPLTKELPAQ